MEKNCPRKGQLWWVTLNKGSSREIIADIQKRISKLQKKTNLPPYNVTTFETLGGLHAHIVFIGNREIVRCLEGSTKFASLIDVDRVNDPRGLGTEYLAKERTSQAGYRREHMFGGRIRGSHRIPGGGDRVRLSRELERDAIEAGYVAPWQHTNATRTSERKTYRLHALTRKAPRPAGQLALSPEFDRPVSRLRQFGGGFVPPSVALEIEHHRHRRGLSQREIAARIGVSQGQYANACRGHDPLSPFAVNRLRDVLRSQII